MNHKGQVSTWLALSISQPVCGWLAVGNHQTTAKAGGGRSRPDGLERAGKRKEGWGKQKGQDCKAAVCWNEAPCHPQEGQLCVPENDNSQQVSLCSLPAEQRQQLAWLQRPPLSRLKDQPASMCM